MNVNKIHKTEMKESLFTKNFLLESTIGFIKTSFLTGYHLSKCHLWVNNSRWLFIALINRKPMEV